MLEGVGFMLADLWGGFFIMYIFSAHIGVPQFVPPFVLVVLMIAYLFSPLPFFHFKARRWFFKIFVSYVLLSCSGTLPPPLPCLCFMMDVCVYTEAFHIYRLFCTIGRTVL
ncbi:unnamed protein product [Dibothriocephalus latus]|uniref:Uncharacterized protein n=1 Tax=Dibothriocephalus latus TaxID=60516 RepID=A0A3P7RW58_DIBLA|nr:unnamed protein product [Dibothriocephalus latus]